jgi:hypothetical protein
LKKRIDEFVKSRSYEFEKKCIFTFKTRPKDPDNPLGKKIIVGMNFCLQDENNKEAFKKRFIENYSKNLNESEDFMGIQQIDDVEGSFFQYYDSNYVGEINNYDTKFDDEGMLMSRDSSKKLTGVKYSFRYDQLVSCKPLQFKELLSTIDPKLKKTIKPDSCCAAYAISWNFSVSKVAFCSIIPEECNIHIKLFKSTIYKKCFEKNLIRMNETLNKISDLKNADLSPKDLAQIINIAKDIKEKDPGRFYNPESLVGKNIQEMKTKADGLLKDAISALFDKLNSDKSDDPLNSIFGYQAQKGSDPNSSGQNGGNPEDKNGNKSQNESQGNVPSDSSYGSGNSGIKDDKDTGFSTNQGDISGSNGINGNENKGNRFGSNGGEGDRTNKGRGSGSNNAKGTNGSFKNNKRGGALGNGSKNGIGGSNASGAAGGGSKNGIGGSNASGALGNGSKNGIGGSNASGAAGGGSKNGIGGSNASGAAGSGSKNGIGGLNASGASGSGSINGIGGSNSSGASGSGSINGIGGSNAANSENGIRQNGVKGSSSGSANVSTAANKKKSTDFVQYSSPKKEEKPKDGSNDPNNFYKNMFKDDLKKFEKEIVNQTNNKVKGAVNENKTKPLLITPSESKDKPKDAEVLKQEKKNEKAADLAKDIIQDFKNTYTGTKLSPSDVTKLAKLIVENPTAFEKMKENKVPLDMETLEKIRSSSSSKDVFKMLDTIVKEKDLKISVNLNKGTRCQDSPQGSNTPSTTLNNKDEPLSTEPLPFVNPEDPNKHANFPTDPNTGFHVDDDFNNLNPAFDMVPDQSKIDEAQNNKDRKILYILKPNPQKSQTSGFKRTVNEENLPKPVNVLADVKLEQKGDKIVLPNGKELATVKGISTGILKLDDPKMREMLIKNAPENPKNPEQGKNMINQVKEEIKKKNIVGLSDFANNSQNSQSEKSKLSKEESEKYKLTLTLVGFWLQEPPRGAEDQTYIQDVRIKGDNAYDLIEKLKKINEKFGKK